MTHESSDDAARYRHASPRAAVAGLIVICALPVIALSLGLWLVSLTLG